MNVFVQESSLFILLDFLSGIESRKGAYVNIKDLFIPQCPGGNHAIKAVKGADSPLVCKTCGTKLKRAFRFDLNRFLVAVAATFVVVFVVLVVLSVLTGKSGPSFGRVLGIAIGSGLFICLRLERVPE